MHIGFDNYVPWWTVRAILVPKTAPVKRLREQAKQEGRLYDATFGRKTRSLVITDTNQVILAPNHPETLVPRLKAARERGIAGEMEAGSY